MFVMVPRLLAPARAMRSRACADVIQPCPFNIDFSQSNLIVPTPCETEPYKQGAVVPKRKNQKAKSHKNRSAGISGGLALGSI